MKRLLSMGLAVALMFFSAIADAQYVVPVKNPSPTVAVMSRVELYWIYSMRTRFWDNGQKIVVFYMNFDSPQHEAFCRRVLMASPVQFKTSVDAYVNAGNAAYFRSVESEQEMIRMVERTPGSVGYLSESTIMINGGGYVRTITISG